MFVWGIIGLGRIAHKFAFELHQTGLGQIQAVASRDNSKAESFAKEYNIPNAYGSYEDFLNRAQVQAVYIAVPHHLHAEYTQKCLERGIPVLCEKPFTINYKELEALVVLARQKKVFLMEAMWARFMPHIQWIKQLVDQNELGNILHMKAEFCFKGKERGLTQGVERLLKNELGGGALLDIGIYPLFLSYLLLGIPVKIQSQANIISDIDENCMMLCHYESGATAYLESSITWESVGLAVIYFEKGTITIPARWHESNQVIFQRTGEAAETKSWHYPSRGFYYEMKEVQDCINAGKTESDLMPLHYSLDIMKMMDQIRGQIGLKYPADFR